MTVSVRAVLRLF